MATWTSERLAFPQKGTGRLRKPGSVTRPDVDWHLQGRESYFADDTGLGPASELDPEGAHCVDSESTSANGSDSENDEYAHRRARARVPTIFPARRRVSPRRSGSLDRTAPAPTAPKERYGETPTRNADLSSAEAHQLLRTLVRHELEAESRVVHSADPENLTHSEDMPLLTYLLRHFLLTLPIIRDEVDDDGRSIFWLHGLQPILQALHESDLSLAVDRKGSHRTQEAPFTRIVERFVSSGLKLRHSVMVEVPVPASAPKQVEAVPTAITTAMLMEPPPTPVSDISARPVGPVDAIRKKPPLWKRALGLSSNAANATASGPRHSPRLSARAPRTGSHEADSTARAESDGLLAALSTPPEHCAPQPISRVPTLPRIEPASPLQPRDVGVPDLSPPSSPLPRDSVLSVETFLTAPDPDLIMRSMTPHAPEADASEPLTASALPERAGAGLGSPVPQIFETGSGLAPVEPRDPPIDFYSGTAFSTVRWGGFEVDVVGVRKHLLSHSYVLRIRRPGRLDDYVLRSEGEMQRFGRKLAKAYAFSHLPPFPTQPPRGDTFVQPTARSERGDSSELWRRSSAQSFRSLAEPGVQYPFARLPLTGRESVRNGVESGPSALPSRSRFAQSLRAQSTVSLGRLSQSRATSFSTRALSEPTGPAGDLRTPRSIAFSVRTSPSGRPGALHAAPPLDGRRRVVRAWIRDLLASRTLRQDPSILAFFFMKPTQLRDRDVLDILQREAVDSARRQARLADAHRSLKRLESARQQCKELQRDLIFGEGLDNLSEALRTTVALRELPPPFRGPLDLLRLQVASWLFEIFVEEPGSRARFDRAKQIHAQVPLAKIRQALRVSRTSKMMRALEDLLLGDGRSRSKTLLEKLLTICLADDPKTVKTSLNDMRARIGSSIMTAKLEHFVYESKQKKTVIRRYSEEYGIELVLCIVRGSDLPRLRQFELDRIANAQQAYRKWTRTHSVPPAREGLRDPDVQLVLDLQDYLTLISKEHDAAIIRTLLGQEDFATAIEVVAQPFLQLLKRLHASSDLAALVDRLEAFLDRFFIVVGALRERVQDPDKSIRAIAKVLEDHEQAFYTFLHDLHSRDDLVDECLQWAWTCAIFVRRGLARPVDFDTLLPPPGSADRTALLAELEQLVSFEEAKQAAAYEATARQYGGEVDADDPVVVDGDGRGRPRVEPMTRGSTLRKPILKEIPRYAKAFREQLKGIFAV